MNLQIGFNRQLRKLGYLMGIPLTILLSMVAMRFIQQASPGRVPGPGVILPDNKIELTSKPQRTLADLNGELEKKEEEQARHKLVSLDFPASSAPADATSEHALRPAVQAGSSAGSREHNREESGLRSVGISPEAELPMLSGSASRTKNAAAVPRRLRQKEPQPPIAGNGFNDFTKTEPTGDQLISRSGIPGISVTSTVPVNSGRADKVVMTVRGIALGDQKVHQGSVVKFRTWGNYVFGGRNLLPNTIFYAYASFEGDRLKFYVNKITAGSQPLPVHLVCQDEDQREGIALRASSGKWAETAEAGKSSAVDEVSSRLPVGSGLMSQVGHRLFTGNRTEQFALADGAEFTFVPAGDQ